MISQNVIEFLDMQRHYPKVQILSNLLRPLLQDGLLIAFSGGVDSGFLLWVASETLKQLPPPQRQGRLRALLTISASIPPWEVEEAKKIAQALMVDLSVIPSQELSQDAYAKNDGTRCYHCKSELFSIAKQVSQAQQLTHIAYGYNATDRKDIRLGHKSAQENYIHAPLEEANLEKTEIQALLRLAGLNFADKPASPCLASRVMTGVRVTEDVLLHIQTMELILRQAQLTVYRVRVHEEHLDKAGIRFKIRYFRIETTPDDMPTILQIRDRLLSEAHKLGYHWVNLDLAGYQMGGGTIHV